MAKDNFGGQMVKFISEILKKIKDMETVCLNGRMGENMKVNGLEVNNMG